MTLGRTQSKDEGTPALGGAAAHQRVNEHELTQAGQLYPQIKAHYTINELLCFWGLLYPVIHHWKLSLPPSFYSLHSFFFFVPGDFEWMINSLNEIAESKEKATTRYSAEQKASTNMPMLTDRIELALRKGKTWEISDWTSFSLTHKQTCRDYEEGEQGWCYLNRTACRFILHVFTLWVGMRTAISYVTKGGAICKQKAISSGVCDSSIFKKDHSRVCVEMSLKCTNTGIFMWLPSWHDAPITNSYSK